MIFSAHNESIFTTNLMQSLKGSPITIDAVVVRKAITYERLREELRMSPVEAFKKILRFASRTFGISDSGGDGFAKFADGHDFMTTSVTKLAKHEDIPCLEVNNFNSDSVIEFLKGTEAHVGVFSGGGLIRSGLIGRLKILNCHMGILPQYRGHFPWVWAILNKDFNNIGLTVHAIDSGVDTGAILDFKFVDISKCASTSEVRLLLEYSMTNFFVEGLLKLASSGQKEDLFKAQESSDGLQYFMPHPKLGILADKILKER